MASKEPIIIQGGIDPVRAFAPLMQVLQQRNEIRLRSQQLELERQRTEASVEQAGAATAESKVRIKETLQRIAQEQQVLLEADEGAALYGDFVARGGLNETGDINPAVMAQLFAEGRQYSPGALRQFFDNAQRAAELTRTVASTEQQRAAAEQQRAAAEQQRAAAELADLQQREIEAELPAREARGRLTARALESASEFFTNPDVRLRALSEPTLGEAVALDALGVLDALQNMLNRDVQSLLAGRSEDAQARIFGRQAAMSAVSAAVQDWGDNIQTQTASPEGKSALFDATLDRYSQSMLGISGRELRTTFRNLMREFQSELGEGGRTSLTPEELGSLPESARTYYNALDSENRRDLALTVDDLRSGILSPTALTVEAAAARGKPNPRLFVAMARRLAGLGPRQVPRVAPRVEPTRPTRQELQSSLFIGGLGPIFPPR